jgi:nitrogen fixation/metabolism regulation signal transduction histidine kinase
MQEYRRSNFFTEKKYQLKYTFVIVMAMLLAAIVATATVYWDMTQSGTINSLANHVFSWDKYMVRIIFLVVAAFLGGVFLSHKIIGPVRRLENMLSDINKGKFDVHIELRTGDDFKGISEQINTLAKKLKALSEKQPAIKKEFK